MYVRSSGIVQSFQKILDSNLRKKGVDEFVDLDSPLHRLLVISDTIATEETASSKTDSSDDQL